MHPHLHTKDNMACAELMTALEECHERGFIWKSLGMCNGAKDAMSQCLRAERAKRTAVNRGVAKEKSDKIRRMWAEIDENS